MSHHGVGLHFTIGPTAAPEQLVIRDTEAHCPACGFEHQIRHYQSVPFHSLTVAQLQAQLARVPAFSAECTQCGHEVTAEDAAWWALHVGFAAQRGTIHGFAGRASAPAWCVRADRALDVQQLPEFEAPANPTGELWPTSLDELHIRTVTGRCWNPKAVVRRWLIEHPVANTVRPVELTPSLVLLDAPAGHSVDQAVAGLADPITLQSWVVQPLWVGGKAASGYHGSPDHWLADLAALLGGRDLWCAADPSVVFGALDPIVTEFPVPTALRLDAGGVLWLRLSGIKEREGAPEIDPREVAIEACRTASAVEDIARLELDRILVALITRDGADDEGHLPGDLLAAPQDLRLHVPLEFDDLGKPIPES